MQNMKRENKVLLLFILCFLVSCKNDLISNEEDLIKHIKDEDNGFSITKEINGFRINSTYKPTDLMILNETSDDVNSSVGKSDSLKLKYKENLYFILSYSRDGKELLSTITESREKFNAVQNILTFDMMNKVSLTNQDNDTIQLLDYNFPRTYGMSRSTNAIFVFKRNQVLDESEELIFTVKDIGIGVGDINFKYSADLIKNN